VLVVMVSVFDCPYLRERPGNQPKLAFSQQAKPSFAIASKQLRCCCSSLLLLARRAVACLLLARFGAS